jgi:hypothetical protein
MATRDSKPDPNFNGGRRNLFRLFFNPLKSAVNGYELPEGHTSQHLPQKKRVISPGPKNQEVFALLGPYAKGKVAAGAYRLWSVQVAEAEIKFIFERAGLKATVSFGPIVQGVTDPAIATATFAASVDGDAPPADRDAILREIFAEVKARDKGQLWVIAAEAPARK